MYVLPCGLERFGCESLSLLNILCVVRWLGGLFVFPAGDFLYSISVTFSVYSLRAIIVCVKIPLEFWVVRVTYYASFVVPVGVHIGLFQLQMRISFMFLRAKDLRRF